ncbi:hypothetical protein X975_11294, partial [Stegodyphus mimosarum]
MVLSQKKTSLETCRLVTHLHQKKGKSIRKIAYLLKLSNSTIFDIIKHYKKQNRVQNKRRPGRPSKLSDGMKHFILRKIKKNPRLSVP